MARDTSPLDWTLDLAATLAGTAVAVLAILALDAPGTVRTLAVLPFAAFLPGYALVSAVYPERYRAGGVSVGFRGDPADEAAAAAGIPPVARGLLAVATSVILVPLAVLAVDALGGLYVESAAVVVGGLTALLCVLALLARWRVDAGERVSLSGFLAVLRGERYSVGGPGSSGSWTERIAPRPGVSGPVWLVFALSLVVLVGSVAAAAALPFAGIPSPQGEDFTEFYLTTQTDDGEYVMGEYPTEFSGGESRPVYVTVANDEGRTYQYTVVAVLQRVDGSEVTDRRELTRFQREVGDGETVRVRHDLQPTMQGSNLRVVYLLYRGGAPSDPSVESAYRHTRLSISVGGSTNDLRQPDAATGEVTG